MAKSQLPWLALQIQFQCIRREIQRKISLLGIKAVLWLMIAVDGFPGMTPVENSCKALAKPVKMVLERRSNMIMILVWAGTYMASWLKLITIALIISLFLVSCHQNHNYKGDSRNNEGDNSDEEDDCKRQGRRYTTTTTTTTTGTTARGATTRVTAKEGQAGP